MTHQLLFCSERREHIAIARNRCWRGPEIWFFHIRDPVVYWNKLMGLLEARLLVSLRLLIALKEGARGIQSKWMGPGGASKGRPYLSGPPCGFAMGFHNTQHSPALLAHPHHKPMPWVNTDRAAQRHFILVVNECLSWLFSSFWVNGLGLVLWNTANIPVISVGQSMRNKCSHGVRKLVWPSWK